MKRNRHYRNTTGWTARLSLLGAAAVLLGCGVENPGAILDTDLDNDLVMQALVTGMSSDFSEGFDDIAFWIARGTDETTGSGSYGDTGLLRRGIVDPDDANGEWADAQRARWVAENGIERMQTVMGDAFNNNRLAARAYFMAGLSNRVLGECFCQVTFDGGPVEPNTKAFERAIPELQKAQAFALVAQTGASDTAMIRLQSAARGALAQVYVGLGTWDSAATYAALVATSFLYNAPYSSNSGREQNVLYVETHNRPEFSVYGTYVGSFNPADLRAPWITTTLKGADGLTPHWRQKKYPDLGADIPVVKGTEMRLIQAEARLRANDSVNAMGFINQVRAYHSLPNLTATSIQQAWIHLDHERLLTLWLEARRYFDLRRWDAAGNLGFLPGMQYLTGQAPAIYTKDPSIAKRATCIPISTNECQTNSNASCGSTP